MYRLLVHGSDIIQVLELPKVHQEEKSVVNIKKDSQILNTYIKTH